VLQKCHASQIQDQQAHSHIGGATVVLLNILKASISWSIMVGPAICDWAMVLRACSHNRQPCPGVLQTVRNVARGPRLAKNPRATRSSNTIASVSICMSTRMPQTFMPQCEVLKQRVTCTYPPVHSFNGDTQIQSGDLTVASHTRYYVASWAIMASTPFQSKNEPQDI